jgi:hypothetical protein
VGEAMQRWSNDDKLRRAVDDLVEADKLTPEKANQQLKLNEAVRYALKDFIGRPITREVIASAEGCVRLALDEMVRSGTYVLPAGLALDRVELGEDMRLKVLFKRIDQPPPEHYIVGDKQFCDPDAPLYWVVKDKRLAATCAKCREKWASNGGAP